jgi:hypothetical protein
MLIPGVGPWLPRIEWTAYLTGKSGCSKLDQPVFGAALARGLLGNSLKAQDADGADGADASSGVRFSEAERQVEQPRLPGAGLLIAESDIEPRSLKSVARPVHCEVLLMRVPQPLQRRHKLDSERLSSNFA